jgi:hypothetical protein
MHKTFLGVHTRCSAIFVTMNNDDLGAQWEKYSMIPFLGGIPLSQEPSGVLLSKHDRPAQQINLESAYNSLLLELYHHIMFTSCCERQHTQIESSCIGEVCRSLVDVRLLQIGLKYTTN